MFKQIIKETSLQGQSLRQRIIIRGGDFSAVRDKFPAMKAKLEEICKFCHFTVLPMILDAEGKLTEEVVKAAPAPKRRFR